MCDDNGNPFIATLHPVLLAPDLCDRLFLIIALINSGHTSLFYRSICTVYLVAKENNAVTLPHSAQREHAFLGKIMEKSEKTITSKKENCYRITTSEIRTQIHQIIVSWGYCQCLGRCRAKNRSRSFLHIISNCFNEQKG